MGISLHHCHHLPLKIVLSAKLLKVRDRRYPIVLQAMLSQVTPVSRILK